MSIISAGTTTTTALVQTGDTTGNLVLQTGSTPTTAMTINSSQIVNFANAPTVGGSPLPSGAMSLISTQTGSSSTIQWTGLNADKFVLEFSLGISTNSTIYIQFGYGSSPTWVSSGYYQNGYTNYEGTAGSWNSTGASNILITKSSLYGGGSFVSTSGVVNITGANTGTSGDYTPFTSGLVGSFTGSGATNSNEWWGTSMNSMSTPLTAIRIVATSGTLSFTASLYSISS